MQDDQYEWRLLFYSRHSYVTQRMAAWSPFCEFDFLAACARSTKRRQVQKFWRCNTAENPAIHARPRSNKIVNSQTAKEARTQSLRAQMVIIDQVSNETAARAYSQQGHGKILKPIQRPDTYQRLPEDVQLTTSERQPVHTSELVAA